MLNPNPPQFNKGNPLSQEVTADKLNQLSAGISGASLNVAPPLYLSQSPYGSVLMLDATAGNQSQICKFQPNSLTNTPNIYPAPMGGGYWAPRVFPAKLYPEAKFYPLSPLTPYDLGTAGEEVLVYNITSAFIPSGTVARITKINNYWWAEVNWGGFIAFRLTSGIGWETSSAAAVVIGAYGGSPNAVGDAVTVASSYSMFTAAANTTGIATWDNSQSQWIILSLGCASA